MSARYLNAIFVAIIMVLVSTSGIIDFDEGYSDFEIETLESEPVVQYPSQATSPGHVVFSQYISSDNCGHCSKTGGGSDAHHSIKQNHPMEFVYVTYMSASYGDTDTARAGNTGPYNWAWSTGGAPQAYFGDRTDEQGGGGPGSGGCAIGGADASYTSYDATFSSGGCMASTTNDYSMSAGISQNGGTYDISISYGYSGSGSPAGNMKLYAALVDKDCTGYSYSSGIPHGYNCWMAWLTSGDTYKSKNGGSGTSFESVTLTSNMQTSTWSSVPTSVVPGGLSKAIVIGVLMSGNSVSVGGSSPHVYHAVDSTMNPMDLSVSDFTVTNDDVSYDGFLAGDTLTLDATVTNTGTEDYSAGGSIQLYHVEGTTENAIGQSVSLNNLNVGQSQNINEQFDTTGIQMDPNGKETFRVKLFGTTGENDPVGNNRVDVRLDHDFSPSADTPVADGQTSIARGSTLDFDVTGNSRDQIDTLETMTAEFQTSPAGSNTWSSNWVIAPTSLTAPGTPSARYVFTVDPVQTAASGDYDVRAKLIDSRNQSSEWKVQEDAFSLENGLPVVVDPNNPDTAPGDCPEFPGPPTVRVDSNERFSLAGLVCDAETDLSSLHISPTSENDPKFVGWYPESGEIEVYFPTVVLDSTGSPGPQNLAITIDDGEDSNTGTLRITVIENGQPRWGSVPAQSFDEGFTNEQLNLGGYLSDTDSSGNPTSVSSLSLAVVSIEPSNILEAEFTGNTLSLSAIDDDAHGNVVVNVRATDVDGQYSENPIYVYVENINDAPRFDSTGLENLVIQTGETLELDLSSRFTDVDGDDAGIWITATSSNGIVQYDFNTGIFTYSCFTPGQYIIQFSADDLTGDGGIGGPWNIVVDVVDSMPLLWSEDGINGDLYVNASDIHFGKSPTFAIMQLSDVTLNDIVAEWQICNVQSGVCWEFGIEEIDSTALRTGHTFVAVNPDTGATLANFDEVKLKVTATGEDGFDYESSSLSFLAEAEPTIDDTTSEEDNDQSGNEETSSEAGGMSGAVIAGIVVLVLLLVVAGVLGAMLLRGGKSESQPSVDWGTETTFAAPAAATPAVPAPAAYAPPVAAAPAVQSVPDYTHLTPGGQYITGHAGETVYLSPDGTAWTMQADSSFTRTS